MGPMELSVVVPLYNEEESVEFLHERTSEALQSTGLRYEILFVDDGSRDRTLELASAITGRDAHLRGAAFRANCGQMPAIACRPLCSV